jgi:hypothetical protein
MKLVDDVGPAQQEMSTAAHMHQPIFGLTPTTNMPSGPNDDPSNHAG